jgi:uncharacterized membrane protein
MERFNALGRGAQIMLVSGVLFLISTFFNWQSVDVGPVEVGQSAWHGFWGVVMGLLAIVLIAWLVARVAGLEIPIPFSTALVAAALAVLIFVFALIKVLTDDFTSSWAWIGLVLAAIVVVGGWLEVQAAGGMNALRSEVSSMQSPTAQPSPAEPAPPPPAPAPEAPAPEAAPPAPPTEPEPPADTDEPRRSDL